MDFIAAVKQGSEESLGADFACRRFLLCVSGGMDSVVLVEAFCRLVPKENLAIAHFNHQTRAADSQQDAEFVQRLAESLGVPFELGVRPPNLGKDEASMRADRRLFLEQAASKQRADYILTGHHLDDQLETVLMRLVRGTGLVGLRGMEPVNGKWFKPLLGISRQRIREHARGERLEFREDLSNQDLHYFRNRIRHELVPVIGRLSEPFGGSEAFLNRLKGMTDEVAETESTLGDQTRSFLAHIVRLTPFWLRLNKALFQKLPSFWQARVLRASLNQLGVPALSRSDLTRVLSAVNSAIPSVSFSGFRLKQSCGFVYFQTVEQGGYAARPRKIDRAGRVVHIPELEIRLNLPEGEWDLRFHRAGDRTGSCKLTDFFLKHRIPQPERGLLPLLFSKGGTDALWVFPQTGGLVEVEYSGFPFAASLKSLENTTRP
jgi:tRNA(Ile)-lysidine synthetase-like protein